MKSKEELQKHFSGKYFESRRFHQINDKSSIWIMGMSDLSVELLEQEVLTRKQFNIIQEALLGLNGDIAGYENKMQAALNG